MYHVNLAGLCHSYRLSTDEAEDLVRGRQEIIAKHTVPSPPRQRPASSDTATPKQRHSAAPLDPNGAADEAAPCGSSRLVRPARPPACPHKKMMEGQLAVMLDQLRLYKGCGQGRLTAYKHFGIVDPKAQELTLLGALVRALPM